MRHRVRAVGVLIKRDPAVALHGEVARHLVGPLHRGLGRVLHAQVELALVLARLGLDGEPSLLYLSGEEGGRGDGDGADELGVGVVLVPHLEEELLGEVADLDAVLLVPLGVQAVQDHTGREKKIIVIP